MTPVDRFGGRVASVQVLAGGLTNEAWSCVFDGVLAVARRRVGPLGDRAPASDELAAMAAVSCAPEVLAADDVWLVTRRVQAVDGRDPVALGRILASVHQTDVRVRSLDLAALARGFDLEPPLSTARDAILEAYEPGTPCLCHQDLSPANLIQTASGVVLIDWEYTAMTDPAFDLLHAVRWGGEGVEEAYLEAGGPAQHSVAMEGLSALIEVVWYLSRDLVPPVEAMRALYAWVS